MPLIYYIEVEYFRRPMRKVKVKHNLLCVYIFATSWTCVGKMYNPKLPSLIYKTPYVDIALTLNMLSNIGTDWICIERLAFSNENWEKGESIENPHYYVLFNGKKIDEGMEFLLTKNSAVSIVKFGEWGN